MPTPESVKRQIDDLIANIVEMGLSGDQNFSFFRNKPDGCIEVTFHQAEHVSVALKDRAYADVYNHLLQERAYNARMPDGGLVQMMYLFVHGDLERHRLAFFPSPHLEEFQNNPEIYLEDEIYADVVAKNIVPFPIRFDFDSREGVYKELCHPKSHLTLGQYENCRIPVSAPLMPSRFMDFILRNFYHTAFERYADRLPRHGEFFEKSIFSNERSVVHVVVPDAGVG